MALINCPKCGKEISDKASECPECSWKKEKSKKGKVLVIIFVVLVAVLAILFGIKKYKEVKIEQEQAERQAKINELLAEIQEYYKTLDLESVEICLQTLDELQYNTDSMYEVLEYDKKVKDDVIDFYEKLEKADTQLKTGTYSSLNSMVETLELAFIDLKILKENERSELGKYIKEVKNNPMFETFKFEILENWGNVDYDYGLTKSGYAIIFETYTDILMDIEFPYKEAIK